MSLQNFQSDFAEDIFSDEMSFEGVYPLQQLIIYKNNVLSMLRNTLREIYPFICQLVGDDFFNAAANEYCARYPSCSSNLHEYGEYFYHFIAEYYSANALVYLAEVALFEWTCHQLNFAAEPSAINFKLLENLQPGQYGHLHLTRHPASQLMKCHYPMIEIVDLCMGRTDSSVDIDQGGLNLLILRRDYTIFLYALSEGEYVFLQAIQENESLAQALDAALSVEPGFKLEDRLPVWIENKTIVDFY